MLTRQHISLLQVKGKGAVQFTVYNKAVLDAGL